MRTVDPSVQAALNATTNQLKARNFIWLTGYDFNTRAPTSIGFHNDVGTWNVSYIDVTDGSTQSRTYIGGGTNVTLDDIPLTADLTVRRIKATFSQLDQNVINQVRGYDLKGAPVEIHRGIMTPGTYTLVAPAVPRFVGIIESSPIVDPAEGQFGAVTLTFVSHTRLLTRTNTDVRSGASQRLRNNVDSFYDDTPTVGNWMIFWGEKRNRTTYANG